MQKNTNFNRMLDTILEYDSLYMKGVPSIPDEVYDSYRANLYKLDPTHEYFSNVGALERCGKIKLPHNMGSLNQIHDTDGFKNWLLKNSTNQSDLIASHKLDGISCLLHYKYGKLKKAFSRGNGVEGADITRHVQHINVPVRISHMSSAYFRSELIMKNTTFNAKYAKAYKHPRNLVAGSMNRKETDVEILADIDCIVYEVVAFDKCLDSWSKAESLDVVRSLGFNVVEHVCSSVDITFDEYSKMIATFRGASDYELDGIVITVDELKKVGDSIGLNPNHSVKIKTLDKDSIKKTKVVDVLWEISKSGFLKPRVEVEPVELFGTTVRYATGFNGSFISTNNIGVGTEIEITKSGSVIPFIVNIVKGTSAKMPDIDYTWNDSGIEIVVSMENETVIFKQCLDFFNSINVELLKEASLMKMFDEFKLWGNPFKDSIGVLLDIISMEWEQVLGTNGGKIYNSLHRRLNNMTYEILMGALPFIGFGFGVRKATQLLSQIEIFKLPQTTIRKLSSLDGFDVKTATKIIKNIDTVIAFIDENSHCITFVETEKTSELDGMVIVMTGFRDKGLKDSIEAMGGRVTSSVSKKTTHLLTVDINSTSGKVKKARSLDIDIILPDSFKDEYNI